MTTRPSNYLSARGTVVIDINTCKSTNLTNNLIGSPGLGREAGAGSWKPGLGLEAGAKAIIMKV